jgi:hypothetical protein
MIKDDDHICSDPGVHLSKNAALLALFQDLFEERNGISFNPHDLFYKWLCENMGLLVYEKIKVLVIVAQLNLRRDGLLDFFDWVFNPVEALLDFSVVQLHNFLVNEKQDLLFVHHVVVDGTQPQSRFTGYIPDGRTVITSLYKQLRGHIEDLLLSLLDQLRFLDAGMRPHDCLVPPVPKKITVVIFSVKIYLNVHPKKLLL